MHNLPWIVFSKTGNIETYLLMKDYEIELSEELILIEESQSDQIDQSD
ncbi:MAG TPA: YqzL family protein [Bacilli bacterium]|uniref:YqzL family protein n=1 Tax=Amphibacillus indicireducens TaxID=1076330 RepID=A0ABP7W1C0_9BACI|nr:YqzL family protein [Bacilli bacterium]